MKHYKIQQETELYLPVKDWFENAGYLVHGEVKNCDLTASKKNELIIAEFKRGLTIELILQGIARQKLTQQVYLVIPRPAIPYRKWQDILYLLKKLDLGLLTVNFQDITHPEVEQVLEPGLSCRMRKSSRKRRMLLKEAALRNTDGNAGGSRGKKLLTVYRESAIQIACYLEKFGTMTPKMLRKAGTSKNKTGAILQANYYGWFEKESRGHYFLSESGKKALLEFQDTAAFYRKKMEDAEDFL